MKPGLYVITGILLLLVTHRPTLAAEVEADPAASVLKGSGSYALQLTSGETLTDARSGFPLFPNDVAQTFADGLLSLLMSDESLIKLSRNSRLELMAVGDNAEWEQGAAGTSGSRYQMQSGKLWFLNKNTNNDIEINTPNVSAAIRGTEIQIEILEDGTTVISVLEGQVEASNPFGTLVVNAGQQAVAPPGAAPFLQVLVDPENEVQWTAAIPNLFAPANFPLFSNDSDALAAEEARVNGLLAATPADATSQVAQARVARDSGRPEDAITIINALLARGEETDEALVVLGWSLLDTADDPQAAIDVFNRITGDAARGDLGLVVAAILQEDYAGARTRVDARLAAGGDADTINAFRLADAWLLLYAGELTTARDNLAALTMTAPGYSGAWALLSMTELLLLDNAAALASAARATTVSPRSGDAWLALANVHQALQDLPEAERAVRNAIANDPQNITARYQLARILFASDRNAVASDVLASALASDPVNADLYTLSGYLALASRRTEAAIAAFGRALELAPGDPEALMGLALAHARQGRAVAAIEEISAAVLASPRRALFRSYWAKILYEFRRHQQALDVLAIAENIDDRDPTPFLYRALILRDLNRPLEALAALNQAIRLNDNRGVYRSRFLLDKDLAIKNVDLSKIYSAMNLEEWAQVKASRSTKLDYTNASAHLFLAGSYSKNADRSWARNSENLVARLLMPATSNTFNTFNDYTVMVERPGVQGNLDLQAGNFSTANVGAYLFGADPEKNFSFQGAYIRENTDGWRGNNGAQSESTVLFAKWSPVEKHDFLFVGAKNNSDRDGSFSRRFEYDAPAMPLNRFSGDVNRLELGYHTTLAPGTDILFHHADLESDNDLSSYTCLYADCDESLFAYQVEEFLYAQPFDLTQVQFVTTFGRHQLLAGGNYLEGDDRLDYSIGLLTPDRDEVLADAVFDLVKRSGTWYLHDIWNISDRFMLEAALYGDDYKTTNLLNNSVTEFDSDSHRLGFHGDIGKGFFTRGFAVEYVLPYFSDRLEPTDVAGIPVYRNGTPGALVDERQLQLGREWASGMVTLAGYDLARSLPGGAGTVAEDIRGYRFALNSLFYSPAGEGEPGPGFSVNAAVETQDIDSLSAATQARNERRLEAGVTWTNQRGLIASVLQRYRDIDFAAGAAQDDDFWLTDMDVSYVLKDRKGIVSLEVNNLFDRKVNWYTDSFVFAGRIPRREFLLTLTLNL